MKKERHFFRELIQRSVLRDVELILLLLQSLDEHLPHAGQAHVRQISPSHLAAALQHLRGQHIAVLLNHVLPRRAGLASHAVPHVELMNRLLQRHLEPNLGPGIELHATIRHLQQRPADIPRHRPNAREQRGVGLCPNRLRRRGAGPDEIVATRQEVRVLRE